MKKILFLAILLCMTFGGTALAQCVPDTVTYPNSGFFPLPSNPLPNGTVGVAYSQLITVNVPADTTINLSAIIGFPFPPVTVSVTSMTIGVVNGLPIGIFGSPNPPGGTILGGQSGCIDISGTPTTSGQYVFNIPTDLAVVVPQQVPVIGGTTQTIPAQVPYNLEIVGGVAVDPAGAKGFSVGQSLPNPTSGNTVIRYQITGLSDMQLDVIDVAGKVVVHQTQKSVVGDRTFRFDASELAPGLYLYRLSDGKNSIVKKMVVE
jgi:hypothetical protein